MGCLSRMLGFAAGMACLSMARPHFTGNFVLDDLVVESPFQHDPKSTSNTTVSFTFSDQDKLDSAPVYCSVEWAVGVSPPQQAYPGVCDRVGINVWFPEGTYHGTRNFTMTLSHTYVDKSVGEYPYDKLTKLADINLTFPGTINYECDAAGALCRSCNGTTIVATVTRAIA